VRRLNVTTGLTFGLEYADYALFFNQGTNLSFAAEEEDSKIPKQIRFRE
jgi:hypothetical protein